MKHAPPREVIGYYTRFPEELRLRAGVGQLEFQRTKELLRRFLPQVPATIVDVGGAAGAYAFWLAGLGHQVHLMDATPRLVAAAMGQNASAARRLACIALADARRLPLRASMADVVLLMGPLYHLTDRSDRAAALVEAKRVLRRGGLLAAAAISRCAAVLDGLAFHPGLDAALVSMRQRSLAEGQYRNETDSDRHFTTAYFHRPDDLRAELKEAGCSNVRVFGVEGAGWLLRDFDERWKDAALREEILAVARLLEEEASVSGASAHLLAVGRV